MNTSTNNQEVFIIGCPRSGTTYLLRLLASSKQFCWITNEVNLEPERLELTKKITAFQTPLIGKKRYLNRSKSITYPAPVEAWGFWNHYFSYFQWMPHHCSVPRNALPSDASEKEIQEVRTAINKIRNESNLPFFLSKYTDFPRIQLIKKAFPKAKFIHIIRDGRAVANSYNQKIKSGEFKTSEEEANWIAAWPSNWVKDYESQKRSPLAFTLIQWKFFIDQIKDELKTIPTSDYIEVKYSDLIADTFKFSEKIMQFLNLKLDGNIKHFIKNLPGDNKNYKWQERLTSDEKKVFTEILYEERFASLLDKELN